MDNQNPFLVLGLPSNATTAEIRDVGQRALMRARLLADEDADSLHAIQAAVEALSDPIVRFRAGIEWPALGPKAAELLRTHPKLLDLRTNLGADRSEVIELLCEGESACGANHIRGVFLLMRACAVLTKQANPTPDGGPLPLPPLLRGPECRDLVEPRNPQGGLVAGIGCATDRSGLPEHCFLLRGQHRQPVDPRARNRPSNFSG